jgi:hypothetical protein
MRRVECRTSNVSIRFKWLHEQYDSRDLIALICYTMRSICFLPHSFHLSLYVSISLSLSLPRSLTHSVVMHLFLITSAYIFSSPPFASLPINFILFSNPVWATAFGFHVDVCSHELATEFHKFNCVLSIYTQAVHYHSIDRLYLFILHILRHIYFIYSHSIF